MSLRPRYSWNIVTPQQLLNKARRELDRLEAAQESGDANQADHALNCAFTCWHVIDWLWKTHEDRWKSEGILNIGKLRDEIEGGPAGLSISICADIANGTKHMFVDRQRNSVDTYVSASNISEKEWKGLLGREKSPTDGDGEPIAFGAQIEYRDPQAVLKVKFSDGTARVSSVLDAAINALHTFISTSRL